MSEGITSNPDISGIGIRINSYVTVFITAVIPQRCVFKWTLTHIRLGAVSQITTLGAFLAWSIYVWANAVTFGSAPECNGKIKYILSYRSVSATAPWVRKFWVIGLGVTAGLVVLGIIGAVLLIRWAGHEGISEDELDLEALADPGSSPRLAISSTVMLQLLVERNKHLILPGETDWAFGQVLSLVMIVASLREVLNFLIDRVRRWREVGDLGDDGIERSGHDLHRYWS
ncbi:hypothetical protein EDB83DRAFT_2519065 [Lactarius deliciosus]|nr:hypothetical protein EDB83DRAFT_2519065 [Lactarius deliciosus]